MKEETYSRIVQMMMNVAMITIYLTDHIDHIDHIDPTADLMDVITSYSIHYTKLYEKKIRFCTPTFTLPLLKN